jgi:hypothetical protein
MEGRDGLTELAASGRGPQAGRRTPGLGTIVDSLKASGVHSRHKSSVGVSATPRPASAVATGGDPPGQAAFGATASGRSLAWTRSLRTATRRSEGSFAKQRSHARRSSASRWTVSPASG